MKQKKTKPKTVKLRIRASQRVSYNQTIEINMKEWKELKQLSGRGMCERLESLIDFDDVSHGDDFQEEDIDVEIVDETGIATDYWEPQD